MYPNSKKDPNLMPRNDITKIDTQEKICAWS